MNELQRFCQWYDEALLMALLGHRLTVDAEIKISADTKVLKKIFVNPAEHEKYPEELQTLMTSTCTWNGQEVRISYQKVTGGQEAINLNTYSSCHFSTATFSPFTGRWRAGWRRKSVKILVVV